ncbi:MAG: hypothetical protein ACR2IL_07560 [Chitinophagaceae bacterium]
MYQFFLENVLLPMGDWVFKSSFIADVKRMRRLVKANEAEQTRFQCEQLQQLLQHATQHTAYYRGLNITPDADPEIWLKRFPVLEKKTIREQGMNLMSVSSTEGLALNSTSGSTGEQTQVYVSPREQSYYQAAQTVWWEWAGYHPGLPIIQTGLAPKRNFKKKIKDFFFRTHYLFAFALTKEQVQQAFQWARGKKRVVIGGYASSLYVFAGLAEDTQKPGNISAAISWGDKMFDHYRKKISEELGCKVYETYGAAEGLMIGAQKDLEYLYIMTPCVYLEILDDAGNPVADGEIGHVVVTSLTAHTMPLIRYKLGDLAIKLPKEKYPAQRDLHLPLLQKVVGRETDIVITPSGKKLIVHSFTGVFEYYSEVRQFCVVQDHVNGVRIDYVKDVNFYPEVLEKIDAHLRRFITEPFEITYHEVNEIPPTKSGKPQIIISNLIRNKAKN